MDFRERLRLNVLCVLMCVAIVLALFVIGYPAIRLYNLFSPKTPLDTAFSIPMGAGVLFVGTGVWAFCVLWKQIDRAHAIRCFWFIVTLGLLSAAGSFVYSIGNTKPSFVSVLPSQWRSADSDDGYKTGYSNGIAYGVEKKESPTAMEFDLLVEYQTNNRPSKSRKRQWSAGYRAGFEAGSHEAKRESVLSRHSESRENSYA